MHAALRSSGTCISGKPAMRARAGTLYLSLTLTNVGDGRRDWRRTTMAPTTSAKNKGSGLGKPTGKFN
eukprot:11173781-Lingulodinium_polyedra.AAC.1